MKIALFFIGLFIGSLAGITAMCMVQINRDTEEELRKAELENEKRHNQTSPIQ